jgi:hypothetical protein
MKKLLITTLIALAVPGVAGAHNGKHHHFRHFRHHHHALYASLSGTGSLASAHGTIASNALGAGTFTSAVTTTGAATTKTGDRGTLSCAPATATLSLVGTSTVTTTLTGKECTWTKAGATTASGSMFWGKNADMKAFLVSKADGTVKGAVLKGFEMAPLLHTFSVRQHLASHATGDCDGH